MSTELKVLVADSKWQEVFSAIIKQYERLQRLAREARELEAASVDEQGRYCYSWCQYHLIFSEYVRHRRRYPPWTTKMVPKDILEYKVAEEQEKELDGKLTLESSLGKPWVMNVSWVCWELLSSIPDIEMWLREVCARHEEAIEDRKKELQVFGEYVDGLADVVAHGGTEIEDV